MSSIKNDADEAMDNEQARVDDEKTLSPALPGIGHNLEDHDYVATRLKSYVERVERLEAEKSELAEDIKEIYGEAKANGYDQKIMRKIVRLRKMDIEKRREEDMLIDLYKSHLGMD